MGMLDSEIQYQHDWLRGKPRLSEDQVYSSLLDEGVPPKMASYFSTKYEYPDNTNFKMLAADLVRAQAAQDYPELYFSKGGQLGTSNMIGMIDIASKGGFGGSTSDVPPYDIFVKNDNSLLHEFGHKNSATLGDAVLPYENMQSLPDDAPPDTRPVHRYLPGGNRSLQRHSPFADLVMEDMSMPRGQRVWDKYPELFPTNAEKAAFMKHAYGTLPGMSESPELPWYKSLWQ